MMVEQHYDDDSLLTLAAEAFATDDHLSSCAGCRNRLDTFRLIADALRDETTWDTRPLNDVPVPETIATLRAFADRMAGEDSDAAVLLPDLLMGPREMWMSNLQRHPEYRTAGMVRRLLEAVPAALHTMPRDAVELTALATEIADHLDDATPQLRGAAWRERAFSLLFAGDFTAAERALCASERHFHDTCASDYEYARLGVVRTSVERGLEKFSSAISHARSSARQFTTYGDSTRHRTARAAEATILLGCGRYDEAFKALASLRTELFGRADLASYGRVVANLGFCCAKLGRISEALQYLDEAAQSFDELGIASEALRARWNAARVLAGEGRQVEALPRLRLVAGEFDRLGMMASATEASLEIAELLISADEFDEVEQICARAMERFRASNLECTAPSLTALALMHEAVKSRTATKKLVSHVREYLRRVPDEPQLLFALPPE